MAFRDEIAAFLTETRISQNKAAEGAGYAGSVVSQYMTGTYKGNTDQVEAALRAWMEREKARRARRSIPIIETETFRRITNAIALAHEEADIAVIAGAAGSGKTTALRKYAEANPNTTILIEVDESMTKISIIQELAEKLGMDRRGAHAELVHRVCEALAAHDMVVLIDEADFLSDRALEILRRVVNDKGRSALVLVGLQRLIFRIKNLKNDHQQLASRVGTLLEVESLKPVDAEKILLSVWPELTKDAIAAFVKAAGGSVRALAKYIDRSHKTALANNLELPDADIVPVAGALILRSTP